MHAHEIQQLPQAKAFMHCTNVRCTVVALTPYWERPDVEQINQDKKAAEALTRRVTA